MPKRSDDYHGGAGWRFSWRSDRLKALHNLGRAFELTEDSQPPKPPAATDRPDDHEIDHKRQDR